MNRNKYISILIITILMLAFYAPIYVLPTHAITLPDKIPPNTWLWSPESPPTPGGVYWNYWSPTSMTMGFWQYLPLIAFVHNDLQLVKLLAVNWTTKGNELIVNLRHPYYWDTVNGPKPFTAWDVWTTYMIGIKLFGWYSSCGLYNVTVINNYTVAFWFTSPDTLVVPHNIYRVLGAYIGAPYFQFGKYADILATLNTSNPKLSSYISNLTTEVEDLNVTPTSNGFYFPNTSTMSDEYMYWYANPYFEQAFPNSSVRYYPNMITYWSSGNTQTEGFLEGGLEGYCTTAIPLSIYDSIKAEGYILYNADTYGGVGFYLNPKIYPFNNPLARQAIYYAVNLTELAAAYAPDYIPGPENFAGVPLGFLPHFEAILPKSFYYSLTNYSTNLSKATSLLEKAGLTYKDGKWYLPNGTQLSLTILAPSGYTDWVALSQELATQLKAFGIDAQVYEIPTSTYYSDFFSGDFEVGPFFTSFADTIDASNIMSLIPQPPFNLSATTWYIFNGRNYTINVSAVYNQMLHISPSSPQYINDTEKLMAWYNYWLPAVADLEKVEPVELNPYQANYQAILSTNNSTFISTMLFPFVVYDFEYMGPVIGFLEGDIVPPGVTPPFLIHTTTHAPTTTTVPVSKPSSFPITYVAAAIVIIVIIVAALVLLRRRPT